MSKHVGENCKKLHISYILSSQRDITPSKIDAKLAMPSQNQKYLWELLFLLKTFQVRVINQNMKEFCMY